MAEHGYWAIAESDVAHAAIVVPLLGSNKEELTVYPLFLFFLTSKLSVKYRI